MTPDVAMARAQDYLDSLAPEEETPEFQDLDATLADVEDTLSRAQQHRGARNLDGAYAALAELGVTRP